MDWTPITQGPWSGLDWTRPTPRTLLDPYMLWAETCQYPAMSPGTEVPLLLQVRGLTARQFARVAKYLPGITVPGLYKERIDWLDSSTYLSARVSRRFFACLPGLLDRWVVRFEYGAPVVPAASGLPLVRATGRMRPTLPTLAATIDDGIAFAHRRFRDPSLPRSTGFLCFWNQDAADGSPPAGVGYGREIDLAAVDKLLATPRVSEDDVYREMEYPHVRRRVTHGTHVLDVMAGGDAGAVVPLMGVQLPGRTLRDTSCMGLSVNVLDAMRYLIDRAHHHAKRYEDAGQNECPLLVNLSYAKLAGPHDGSSMLEGALDELVELRHKRGPLTLMLPAGNHRQARCHAAFDLAPTVPKRLRWKVQPDDLTPSFLEIWCPAQPALKICVRAPGSAGSTEVVRGESQVLTVNGRPCALVSFLHQVSRGDGTMVLVAVAPTSSLDGLAPLAPQGIWEIEVVNLDAVPVTINAWIQRDEPLSGNPRRGRQSRFDDPLHQRWDPMGRPGEVDAAGEVIRRAGTLNALATGTYPVVLGAYRGRDDVPAVYTGAGERGMRVPDAALKADDSLVLRGRLAAGSVGNSRVAMSGTSVAAPQALRALLELNVPSGQGVNARQTVEQLALAAEAKHPKPRPPDSVLGSGRLNTRNITNRKGDR